MVINCTYPSDSVTFMNVEIADKLMHPLFTLPIFRIVDKNRRKISKNHEFSWCICVCECGVLGMKWCIALVYQVKQSFLSVGVYGVCENRFCSFVYFNTSSWRINSQPIWIKSKKSETKSHFIRLREFHRSRCA